MGVTGLLQNLKEIQRATTLEKYRGQTLAIDAYGWLHRGLISCAQELCLDQPTRKYITLFMNKIAMLRHFGVVPYVVFDGAALPTKAETARERRQRREEARTKADLLVKQGKRLLAWKEFMKAALVTSLMAKSIMVELDLMGVKYVVAPYEADPQMVYLELAGYVNGIISEDSDLLIFGCKTLITKLKDNGSCVEVCRDDFGKVKLLPYLSRYTQEELRLVAMLSGCDYTKGVAGIGLKTAFNLVKRYSTIGKLLLALRAEGKAIPDDFEEEATKANYAFQFQKVFDPIKEALTTLMPYPENVELDEEVLEMCCGRTFDTDLYKKLCRGQINPHTHELLVSREQALVSLKAPSVSSGTSSLTRGRPSSILDMLSASKPDLNPQRQPLAKAQRAQPVSNLKLSPCSRKVQRIQGPCRQVSGGVTSKFFVPQLELNPSRTSSLPTPDTSVADSSVEEELSDLSSPVKRPAFVDGSDDILTDDDSQQVSMIAKPQLVADPPAVIAAKVAANSLNSDGFDFDEFDEDLEESPLKKTTAGRAATHTGIEATERSLEEQMRTKKLDNFRNILRENFLFNAATKLDSQAQFKRIKLIQETRIGDHNCRTSVLEEEHSSSINVSPVKKQFRTKGTPSRVNGLNIEEQPANEINACTQELGITPTVCAPRQSLLQFAYTG